MSKVIYIPHDLAGGIESILNSVDGSILFSDPLAPQATDWGTINVNQRIVLHKPYILGSPAEFPTLWEWDHAVTISQVGTWNKKYGQTGNFRSVGANFWICDTENGGSINTPGFHKHDENGLWLLSKGPVPFIVNGVSPFCIDDTETIASYSNGFNNSPIKTWNLSTNLAGPDISAGLGAGFRTSELFAIPGSTDIVVLLTFYNGTNPTQWLMRRYTQAGAQIYETIIDTDSTILLDNTFESGIDPDFASIWVRWPSAPNYDSFTGSSFRRYRLSDGAPLNSKIDVPTIAGLPATTCPVIVLDFTPPIPPNVNSGIYKLVPGKRNDSLWDQNFTGTTDVKIPNPTGRTGYVG